MDSGSRSRVRRILVIANETCAGSAVVQEVAYRAGVGAEVIVVAPALAGSRLKHWFGSDAESAREAAEARLGESIRAFAGAGLRARGHLGDSDPLQALDDALRLYEPNEVVIATHPPRRSNWLERDVVRRARDRYRLPVTHVVVDLEHEFEQAQTDAAPERPVADILIRVYYETTYEDAIEIRRSGFADVRREAVTGVVVTERPVGAREPGDSPILFAVDLPAAVLEGRTIGSPGDEPRSFLVPAELLNAHGPPIAVGDWSE